MCPECLRLLCVCPCPCTVCTEQRERWEQPAPRVAGAIGRGLVDAAAAYRKALTTLPPSPDPS